MAERKSGPVKPPVIDLAARDTSDTTSDKSATGPRRRRSASAARAARPGTETIAGEGASAAPATTEAAQRPPASSAESNAPSEAPAETATAAAERRPAEDPAPREATSGDAEPGTEDFDSTPVPPRPPRPPARLAMPWSAISISVIAGGLLGAALTYLAANWIALPQQAPPFADPAPALEELAARATALEARLAAVEATARTTRVSLDATLAQFDAATAELRQQIQGVAASIPEPQAVDLSAIEAELQTLESRVGAIAAGASSDDAAALATDLAGIESGLEALAGRLTAFEGRQEERDGQFADLARQVAAAENAIAAQTRTLGGTEIGPAVKLPLIVSGLEAAFATGRSYDAELAGLTALLPTLSVPPQIAENSETGLARPDALAARFDAALPDIIAGRTHESTGDWAQDAMEWAKALLALRPADEVEGDSPEAIISRLEAAMERRDFVAAAALLAQLPEPMRNAAGDVGNDITAHAQATTFIGRLRTEALTPATEPTS